MNTKCIECCVSVSIKPSTKLSNSTFNFEENEMRVGEKKRVVIKKNSKYYCYAGFWHANCAIGKWSTVTFLAHHSVYAIHCMPFSHRSKNHWFWTAHTDVINCTLQRILRLRREKKNSLDAFQTKICGRVFSTLFAPQKNEKLFSQCKIFISTFNSVKEWQTTCTHRSNEYANCKLLMLKLVENYFLALMRNEAFSAAE